MIHYAQNVGCDRAMIHGVFNSDDPGFIPVASSTFKFSEGVVESTINIDQDQFNSLKKGLPAAPAQLNKQDECLKRCNIQPVSWKYKMSLIFKILIKINKMLIF